MKALGWRGPDLPHGEDWLYKDIRYRGEIPKEVDLALPPVQDQYTVGCCVHKSITCAMETALVFEGNPEPYYLSALDGYYDYRLQYGNPLVDDGAFIRMALDRARKRGICRESHWPYDEGESWNRAPFKPADVYYRIASYWRLDGETLPETIDHIQAALASGTNKVIIFGATLYESFLSDYTAKTGNVDMPNYKAEKVIGGHCMVAKGYTSKERLRVRNSWGQWGYEQSGDCFLPFDYLTLARDFHIVDVVTEG